MDTEKIELQGVRNSHVMNDKSFETHGSRLGHFFCEEAAVPGQMSYIIYYI